MFSQASVILFSGGSMYGSGVSGGHVWQGGMCGRWGMHGRKSVWLGVCMAGGVLGRGHVWQGGMHSGGCAWWVHTCVTAAGSFTVRPSVFPIIPAESGIPKLRMGSARPYQVGNRILIYSGGLGLPHQQGWGPCFGLLSTLLSSATVLTTRTRREEDVSTVLTASRVSSTPCFRRYY